MALYRDSTGQLVVAGSLPPGGSTVTPPASSALSDMAPWFRNLDSSNNPGSGHPATYYAGNGEPIYDNGYSTAVIYAYKRSATLPTDNPGGITYDFTTAQITTTLANGWSKTIPSGADPLYAVTMYASSQSPTKNLLASAWSSPVLLVANSTSYWLTSSVDVLKLNANNTFSPATITVYGYSKAGDATPGAYSGRFKIYENGSATASYTSSVNQSSYTYTPSGTSVTSIKVELYLAGGTTTKLDEETINVVVDGSNAPTLALTNDSITFAGPVSGYSGISFTNGSCVVTAYYGATQLSYAASGANTFSIASQSSSGVTVAAGTGSGTQFTVPAPTAMSADNAYTDVSFTLRGPAGTTVATLSGRITYSLSRTGATGATGPAGADGASSTSYWLSCNVDVLKLQENNTFLPTTLIVYGYAKVGDAAPGAYAGRFKIYENGSATASYTSSVNQSSYTYTPSSTSVTSIKVELYLAGGTTTKLDEETITVVADGSNAPTLSLTNDSITFTGQNSGYSGISFTNGSCVIKAYYGATLLSYAASGANTFSVASQTSSGVTVAAGTGSGTQFTVPAPTAMSADNAYTDVSFTLRGPAGTTVATLSGRITYSLSRMGAAGSTGSTGASVFKIYYLATNSASPPATPGATSNGATPAGWSATPVSPTGVQAQFESDGTQPAGSTTTTWSTPYLSYFKVNTLSAITANTGSLTVDNSLTMGTGAVLKSGQTGFDTGTGYWLDYNLGTPRFSLGSGPSGAGITWNGSTLTVRGDGVINTANIATEAIGVIRSGATALTSVPNGSSYYDLIGTFTIPAVTTASLRYILVLCQLKLGTATTGFQWYAKVSHSIDNGSTWVDGGNVSEFRLPDSAMSYMNLSIPCAVIASSTANSIIIKISCYHSAATAKNASAGVTCFELKR